MNGTKRERSYSGERGARKEEAKIDQQTGRAHRLDELKKGQRYTGMATGGSHHWTYDSGQWDEEEPDLWKVKFEARKHRQRHTPKGTGGTRWDGVSFILADSGTSGIVVVASFVSTCS
ncbi:hypothetical protein JVT61DRAFT_15153 [Boletus reticuloceps]|uniref:Uncharacterized protein n=1 Tax=Boletus reticuloceps TaxID=495285 RepID=A0A8I3ABJ0_9AGAM|nr:hypothetical protein JVT61DRAFT_15153 [Boletus reticuloceps]